jgi:hypothetical protein
MKMTTAEAIASGVSAQDNVAHVTHVALGSDSVDVNAKDNTSEN